MHVPAENVPDAEIRHIIGGFLVIVHRKVFQQSIFAGEMRQSVMVLNGDDRVAVERTRRFFPVQPFGHGIEQHCSEMVLLNGVGQLFVHQNHVISLGQREYRGDIAVIVIFDLSRFHTRLLTVFAVKPFRFDAFGGSAVHKRQYRFVSADHGRVVRRAVGVKLEAVGYERGVILGYFGVGQVGIAQ